MLIPVPMAKIPATFVGKALQCKAAACNITVHIFRDGHNEKHTGSTNPS